VSAGFERAAATARSNGPATFRFVSLRGENPAACGGRESGVTNTYVVGPYCRYADTKELERLRID